MAGQQLLHAGGQQHRVAQVRWPGSILGQQIEVLLDMLAVAHERQQQRISSRRGAGDGGLDGLVGLLDGGVHQQCPPVRERWGTTAKLGVAEHPGQLFGDTRQKRQPRKSRALRPDH